MSSFLGKGQFVQSPSFNLSLEQKNKIILFLNLALELSVPAQAVNENQSDIRQQSSNTYFFQKRKLEENCAEKGGAKRVKLTKSEEESYSKVSL